MYAQFCAKCTCMSVSRTKEWIERLKILTNNVPGKLKQTKAYLIFSYLKIF